MRLLGSICKLFKIRESLISGVNWEATGDHQTFPQDWGIRPLPVRRALGVPGAPPKKLPKMRFPILNNMLSQLLYTNCEIACVQPASRCNLCCLIEAHWSVLVGGNLRCFIENLWSCNGHQSLGGQIHPHRRNLQIGWYRIKMKVSSAKNPAPTSILRPCRV
jgi:hypothetical protein